MYLFIAWRQPPLLPYRDLMYRQSDGLSSVRIGRAVETLRSVKLGLCGRTDCYSGTHLPNTNYVTLRDDLLSSVRIGRAVETLRSLKLGLCDRTDCYSGTHLPNTNYVTLRDDLRCVFCICFRIIRAIIIDASSACCYIITKLFDVRSFTSTVSCYCPIKYLRGFVGLV
jgi:hypothetical protein